MLSWPHSDAACSDGDVQPLIGGVTANEGFVEICFDGVFHPVLPDTFTVAEARVACRQLGLGSGICVVCGNLAWDQVLVRV